MTLSKKAVRPAQASFLLANGILPISLDYRLCPEINLIDGPITDVRDACAWAQTSLQAIVRYKGITIDPDKTVVIGWSTGGHLAMTTAWTTKETGVKPPRAILSFYGPTDFESGGEHKVNYIHRHGTNLDRPRCQTRRNVSGEAYVDGQNYRVSSHPTGMYSITEDR